MAFVKQQFGLPSSASNGSLPVVSWTYWNTADTLATMLGASYFDSIAAQLHQNDLIWAAGSDDAALLKVTSANGVTPVTVVQETGAAANLPLAEGNVFVGNAGGSAVSVDISATGTFLRGNGTTAVGVVCGGYIRVMGRVAWPGGTSNALALPGVTATDIISASINSSTNLVNIQKVVAGAGTVTVTFSADPGAGTNVDLVAFINV